MAAPPKAGASPVSLEVTVSQRDIDRVTKRLAKMHGKPLEVRMLKAMQGGVSLLVNPIRAQTPIGKTGNLRRSVRVKKLKTRPGEVAAYVVGPGGRKGSHRHLVIRGHEIVGHRPNLTRTGQMTRANPFVDRAVVPLQPRVKSFVAAEIGKL